MISEISRRAEVVLKSFGNFIYEILMVGKIREIRLNCGIEIIKVVLYAS